jgi:uncharacterized protein (TIGR00369 family)
VTSENGIRTATVSWREAGLEELQERAQGVTGLEFIRQMIGDRVPRPPVAQVLGIEVVAADPGRVEFRLTSEGFMTNHLGVVAGGILATALDSALGCAVLTTLPVEQDIVTLDLGVDFLRPLRTSGSATVTAEVVHSGSRRALAHGQVHDAEGRLCATGRSGCLIVPKRG